MSAAVGKIGPFDVGTDNWTLYVERLEQYFIVNDIKEEKKAPILITVMGGNAYEMLVTLCTPEKPASKKFAYLVTVMKNHLQPQPSVLAERYKFRQRKQQNEETIANYIAELRKLSRFCDFKTWMEESLRDQLVCGLHNELIRQRLFAEDELTFEKALKLAVAMEAAETNAAAVEGRGSNQGTPVASTTAVCQAISGERRGRGPPPRAYNAQLAPARRAAGPGARFRASAGLGAARASTSSDAGWQQRQCRACGGRHDTASCKFNVYVCRVCCKEGHLQKVCPNTRNSGMVAAGVTTNYVTEEVMYSDSDDSGEAKRYNQLEKLNRLKGKARSYVWWPGIDADVEGACRECAACIAEAAAPPRSAPQPWQYPREPWTRLHMDFFGPYNSKMFFILIDSSTKWIEAFYMQNTTASAVIKVLREIFARFGLPREMVSDNGPPFTSRELVDFMTNNGIKQTFSPVYHPASNGAAEGAVKLCKRAVKKAVTEHMDIEAALQTYLMSYRNTEQSTTGNSPAMLLQRRTLRSRLDLLRGESEREDRVHEAQRRQVEYAGGTTRDLKVGEQVWARGFGAREKWISGQVKEKLGTRNYIINRENGQPLKRHIDQLRSRSHLISLPSPNLSTSSQEVDNNGELVELNICGQGDSNNEVISPEKVDKGESTAAQEQPPLVSGPEGRPRRIRKPIERYGFEID